MRIGKGVAMLGKLCVKELVEIKIYIPIISRLNPCSYNKGYIVII
jgi:hypothetical protein